MNEKHIPGITQTEAEAHEIHLHLILLRSMLSDLTTAAKAAPEASELDKGRINTLVKFNVVGITEIYKRLDPAFNIARQNIIDNEEADMKGTPSTRHI